MRGLLIAVMVPVLALADGLVTAERAGAEIVININKATQRMAVVVDGAEQHVWAVSTGLGGGPPTGTYRPERLERKWFSRKYNWSPMPHSIFFHEGYAIHGTIYVSRLGNRASHGCVRLHPSNAATLFSLVQGYGKGRTTIVIGHTDYVAKPVVAPAAATVTRRRLGADPARIELMPVLAPAEVRAVPAAAAPVVATTAAETAAIEPPAVGSVTPDLPVVATSKSEDIAGAPPPATGTEVRASAE